MPFNEGDCRRRRCQGRRTCNIYKDVPSFTLTLEEGQNVFLTDRSLHVTDEGPARVVEKLNADLGDTTTRASASENLFEAEGNKHPVVLDGNEMHVLQNILG